MKSEPASPRKMRAGLKLSGRNPSAAPASAIDDQRHDRIGVQHRDHEEEEARDRRDAGEQAVEPVDEVDRVHHADVPEQRERNAEPKRKVDQFVPGL